MISRNNDRNKIVWVEAKVGADILKNSREMRKSPTQAEESLWQLLRNRKLNNWKFRRQHPFAGIYIIDFFCVETGVAIEVDGEIHESEEQKCYDDNRTRTLAEYGVRVIRFNNADVINAPHTVLRAIADFTKVL